MKIDIALIPGEVVAIAKGIAKKTTIIRNDLSSSIVTDVAAMFPGGTQLDTDCINACNIAITACQAAENIAGSKAVQAICQRLGADLTAMQHDSKHSISEYIIWFERIFDDVFGKQD